MSASRGRPEQRRRRVEEGAQFWFWDPSHFPEPVTPAAETFDLPAMARGFAAAAAELRRPLAGQYVRVERGYVYFGVDVPPTPAALAAGESVYQATVAPRLETALRDWNDRYATEARQLTAALERIAASTISDRDYAAALDEAIHLRAQQWRVHDLALVPAMEAAARFTGRYGARFGGALRAQTLLQGFPNRATEASEALESLAEAVRLRPALMDRLIAGAAPSLALRSASSDDEAWFTEALDTFLAGYGARAAAWDVGAPTWRENPAPVLSLLADHLRRPAAEPGAHRRRAAAAREAAVAAARAGLDPDEQEPFMRALAAAQAYVVVSEDHNALIDQQGMAALRAVLLAAGDRLVRAGRLAQREDAIWLRRPELIDALRDEQPVRGLPGRRRGWHRRYTRTPPPRTMGRPLPDWAAENPTLTGFFGLGAEPVTSTRGLSGTAASPGTAAGRACVVRSLDEIDALEPGDILICPMTSPAWTPWLGLIAGAIVETGGLLSHTAILAREYGIPCVTNARDATSLIDHGATVQIDGDAGRVTW
ncbi:MAG: PEP-utilizing enzyme [Dehalococcoidia bacterium]